MNIFEVIGIAFLGIVVINLATMMWAIKKARLQETLNLNNERES
jgi:hypothetical protein